MSPPVLTEAELQCDTVFPVPCSSHRSGVIGVIGVVSSFSLLPAPGLLAAASCMAMPPRGLLAASGALLFSSQHSILAVEVAQGLCYEKRRPLSGGLGS